MDIQEKQAEWNQERPLFEAEFIHSHLLPFFNFNENTGDYEIKSEYENDEDRALSFNVLNTGWAMWLRAKRDAKAQAVPKWVSVEDRLPPCDFEFCETGEHVSNVVLIHSATTCGFNMGMGHVNEDGVWNAYSGEHDFMNVLMVTHWMPLPDAPQEPADD